MFRLSPFFALFLVAVSASLANNISLEGTELGSNATLPSFYKDISGRIISGSPAAKGQFPWQVALDLYYPYGSAFCGGALISSTWILTAAQCVDQMYSGYAYLGVTSLDDNSNKITGQVRRGVLHPKWNTPRLANDIALIELYYAVAFSSTVHPIRLATDTLESNFYVVVSGWGRTSDESNDNSRSLNYVGLTTIDNQECENIYPGIIQDKIVCARGSTIQSSCSGDSGGPLVTGYDSGAVHVGTVSFGSNLGCARGFPTGYTRTASYRSWIRSVSEV